MKAVIAYYSFTSNNEKLALYLQKLLNCDVVKVQSLKKRNVLSILLDIIFDRRPRLKPVSTCLSNYDHVILVAPIWGGRIATPMRSFMINEAGKVRHYSFITVCGDHPNQKNKIRAEVMEIFQKPPVELIELNITELLTARKIARKNINIFGIKEDDFDVFYSQLRSFVKEENMVNSI